MAVYACSLPTPRGKKTCSRVRQLQICKLFQCFEINKFKFSLFHENYRNLRLYEVELSEKVYKFLSLY